MELEVSKKREKLVRNYEIKIAYCHTINTVMDIRRSPKQQPSAGQLQQSSPLGSAEGSHSSYLLKIVIVQHQDFLFRLNLRLDNGDQHKGQQYNDTAHAGS